MIYTSRPYITEREKDYVMTALNATNIGNGGYITLFENDWAGVNNYPFGVSCNSGTSALYLALLALGIGKGDEVIVPEFTMISTAWAVTYTGARPVFVDCLDDLTVDPVLLKKSLTKKTKAIMVVPIYGRTVSTDVYSFARDNGLFIIEDMAEAHGVLPKGDIACYSFHATKIITTGGGGMCLTKNKVWADDMRSLSHLSLNKDMTMLHPKIGYNFRMNNLQAAIGLAQVDKLDEILTLRDLVVSWYDEYIPQRFMMPHREVAWVYDINCGDDQEKIKKHLFEKEIESRYFFKPMSQQPMYLGDYEDLTAYKWSRSGLYLPLYPELTEDEVHYIASCLSNV